MKHALFAIVFFAASTAHAAPTPDKQRAAQSFAVAEGAFARGEYAVAGAAFEQAALYASHPATLLNAAEAWELAGNPARAAQLCDRVLEMPGLEPRYRDVANDRLAHVKPKIATLTIEAKGLRVTIDDGKDDVSGRRTRLAAGTHTATMTDTANGDSRTETFTARAGEAKSLRLALHEPATDSPKPAEPSPEIATSSGPPLGTWIAFGVALVAAGAGTFFAVRTVDAKDRFDSAPTRDARDDFYGARLGTDVAFGIAAAAAVTGAVIWLVAPERRQTGRGPSVVLRF